MIWPWSMKEKSRKEMPIERRWRWLGRWWRICSPWIGGNAISYRSQIRGAQRPRNRGPPRRKNNRITQRADCQVLRLPTERRRSNSRGSLRIVSGLAENTHSIFCDGPHGPETVNGCPVLRRQEPPPRGTRVSCRFWQVRQCALLLKRASGESFSPLTRDLHGRRQNIVLESRLRVGFFYRKTGERAAERNVCSEDRTAGCGNTLVFRDDLFSSQTTRSCSASALTGLALLQTF